MTTSQRSAIRQLTEDGSLALIYSPSVASLVERWLPRLPRSPHPPPVGVPTLLEVREQLQAVIRVRGRGRTVAEPETRPTLSLGSALAWHLPPNRVALSGSSGACGGTIELDRRTAALDVEPRSADLAAADLYSSLTIAAAFLLGRQQRTLIHAAAAVAPSGGGWLLAGDARSGKSTTCASLISLGWAYLSDDQVVMSQEPSDASEVCVEGWPRDFHLDEGWEAGVPTGSRQTVDPRRLGSGGWQRSAPLAGTLLTDVVGGRPTALSPVHPAETLAALVRQAPWLMADPVAAPACLELLASAAALPGFRLELGVDCFGDAAKLAAVLGPVIT